MNSNMYELLDKNYSELYNLCNEINDSIFTSPHSVIVKARIFAEQISKEIAKLENMPKLDNLSLADRLTNLRYNEILDKEINDYFYEIRKIGNKAAHEDVEDELLLALQVHRNVYKITGWFIETYVDYTFKTPIYKSPKPLHNVNLNEKENNTIMSKFIEKIGKLENILNINNKGIKVEHETEKSNCENDIDIPKQEEKNNDDRERESNNLETLSESICLIQELSKLKESSKEAVEGLNTFTEFKRYMHVDRNVQRELEDIILEGHKQDNSQLILVCGSVGDGKSHIISYFKNKYPEIMAKFTLHNDATESLEPDKTSMDTLNDLLENFTDEKIEISNEKLILAINLGTLNNFIDSKYGERITKLKAFVNEKKILEKSIVDNKFDEDRNIQFINFSDYSLYTLKDGRIESEYIKSLIKKITDKSEMNYFYKSYQKNCIRCENNQKCPIKANYELMAEHKTQDAIVDLLVQCIIKNKIIISTRALLNFIYDLLINRSHIDVHDPMFKDKIGRLKDLEYINSLTPNMIFEQNELSFIFKSLNTLDPLNIRNREVDDFIIKFNNSTNIMEFFKEYIDYPKGYLDNLNKDKMEEKINRNTRKEVLKLFIRSYYLCGKGELFDLRDEVYNNFIEYVYHWNRGDKPRLKDIYSEVKDGVLKWNGEADKNFINIFIGKNQIKYKTSEYLELKADTGNLPSNTESKLEKFLTTIEIKYKSDKSNMSYGIDIDFPLYELLIRVGNGYRPNKKDKNQFIKFIEFMNKIESAGSQNKELIFTEKNRDKNKKFKLEYDDEFEIYRFMEI